MHVLLFGNKLNVEVCRRFISVKLFNSLYLLVRLWWNTLVADLVTYFQDLVAKVKNLVTLVPVLGAISHPVIILDRICLREIFFLFSNELNIEPLENMYNMCVWRKSRQLLVIEFWRFFPQYSVLIYRQAVHLKDLVMNQILRILVWMKSPKVKSW